MGYPEKKPFLKRLQSAIESLTTLFLLGGEGLPGKRLRFLLIGVGNTFVLLGINLILLLNFPQYE